MSENELILGCKLKNPRAQNELVKRYTKELIILIKRYTKNYQDAEDVVQESLTNVINKIDQYNGDGSFDGWIKKITINRALKKYKKLCYVKECYPNSDVSEFTNYMPPNILSEISYKEIMFLVEKLPQGYKTIFNLCALHGYTHEQISKIMGIKSGTSRSQYAKARVHLQKLILNR